METKLKPVSFRKECGFSLIEVMAAMGIMLVVLAAAYGFFKAMVDINSVSAQTTENVQGMQSGLTMIRRDLQQAWRGVPEGGIEVPGNTIYNGFLFGLEPGNHSLTVMYEVSDDSKVYNGTLVANGNDGTKLIVDAATFKSVGGGDFVRLIGAVNDAKGIMQVVTSKDSSTNTILFKRSVTVSPGSGINKDATDAAISPRLGAVTFRTYRRITYTQSTQTAGTPPVPVPWLMRTVNESLATPSIPGVTRFDLTYQQQAQAGAGLSPFVTGAAGNTFHNIRVVHVDMATVSEEALMQGTCTGSGNSYTGKCGPSAIATDMAVRVYRRTQTAAQQQAAAQQQVYY